METVHEQWRPVNGEFNGWPYEVNLAGEVRHSVTETVLNQVATPTGYLCVNLKGPGGVKFRRVHRLVLSAFVHPPNGSLGQCQANHIDGDKKNNCLANLEWTTSSDNHFHAYKNGLRSEKQYLKPDVVRAIRESSGTLKEVAAKCGVGVTSVHRIRRGERHAEVV